MANESKEHFLLSYLLCDMGPRSRFWAKTENSHFLTICAIFGLCGQHDEHFSQDLEISYIADFITFPFLKFYIFPLQTLL